MRRRAALFGIVFVLLGLTACGGMALETAEVPVTRGTTERVLSESEAFDSAGAPQPTMPPTAEASPDVMIFQDYGVNPFVDAAEDNLSTFAIDVDTGAYTLARRYLNDGLLPPQEAVRAEEFINYFDYAYPLPEELPFAIHLEAAPNPFDKGGEEGAAGSHLLRVGIQGYQVPAEQRPDALLIFVVDVSGSMDQENRLGLVRRSLHVLLDNLRPSDQIGLVVYGSTAQVILEPTAVRSEETIRRAIDRLQPGGSTNVEHGLRLAYELAEQHARPGNINRLILASDGVANVGQTTAEAILEYARRGVQLSSFGFGMGNYNDVLMEQLANQGDGSYAYIDTIGEAERVFEHQLLTTILTIAKDAKIQVEFNPEQVERYRLIGYENRDVADDDFRNDAVDAGEIGAGHSVTALYEVRFRPDAAQFSAEPAVVVRLRYAEPRTGAVDELTAGLALAGVHDSYQAASTSFQLAVSVAQFAELLRQSPYAAASWSDAAFDARRIGEYLPGDADVQEFTSLVQRAADLQN